MKSKKNREYLIVGERLDERITINYKAFYVIKSIYNSLGDKNKLDKIYFKHKKFIDDLIELGVIVDDNKNEKSIIHLSSGCVKLPLSSLNIELTDGCNLNCIHCYNDFGHRKVNFLSLDSIVLMEDDLNELDTFSVSLTGGESTIHPQFSEIVDFFIKRGYEITIFTNGYKPDVICDVIKKYRYKKITIKISLDGFESIHNRIRGNNASYRNVIKLLEELKEYDNAKVIVSSVAMKTNIDSIAEFKEFFIKNYPMFIYSTDLITPTEYNKNFSFNIEDLSFLECKAPFLFEGNDKAAKKTYRCSGGISQCTLMTDGKVKICNGACAKTFEFKFNVFQDGLLKTWYECGENIDFFRRERTKETKNCKRCKLKKKCNITNCRVKALAFTGDYKNSDPVACYITRRNQP